MPLTSLNNDEVDSGILHESDVSDTDFTVGVNVIIYSIDQSPFVLTASDHNLLVLGFVRGANGIVLGNGAEDSGNVLATSAGARIYADNAGVTLRGQAQIFNEGEIWGGNAGVEAHIFGTGETRIVNSGSIVSANFGIQVQGESGGRSAIINEGFIKGAGFAILATSAATLEVINRSTIQGKVLMGSGDDIFDNAEGVLRRGKAEGQGGSDIFVAGDLADRFDGGDGVDDIDTLDFRTGGGLRVNLGDADGSGNTGRARNDTYTGFEQIWGSLIGADTLIGDAQNNTLEGFGGRDVLNAGGLDDLLIGGAGVDRLRGGLGDDIFRFDAPRHGGDVIFDFRSVLENDRLEIDASSFGGGLLAEEVVTDAQFDAQLTNVAKTTTVRFIWESDEERLWFDRNGSGDGQLFLLADLQDGAELSRGDIWLI